MTDHLSHNSVAGSEVSVPAKPGSRRAWLAWLGLVLSVAGPALWIFGLDNPLIRRTAWPMWPLSLAGLALAIAALWQDRRWRVWTAVLGSTLMLVLALLTFFPMSRLPQASAMPADRSAADFTLPDHTGRSVSLAALREQGHVLLVFYRGHW